MSRYPTFQAPLPSSYDELFVIKSIQAFHNALNSISTQSKPQIVPVGHISQYNEFQPIRSLGEIGGNISYLLTHTTDQSTFDSSDQSYCCKQFSSSPHEGVANSTQSVNQSQKDMQINHRYFSPLEGVSSCSQSTSQSYARMQKLEYLTSPREVDVSCSGTLDQSQHSMQMRYAKPKVLAQTHCLRPYNLEISYDMDTSNNLSQNTTLNSTLNNSTNTVDFANTTIEQTNLLNFVENFSTSSPNFRTSSQIRPKMSTVRPLDRPSRIDQIRSRNIARQRHSRERFVVTRGQYTQKGRSKNHKVFTNFKDPLVPRQVKGRKVPIHLQDRVTAEIKILIKDKHIEKLEKCTTDHFIAPIVLTAKKDGSRKLALNAKPMNAQIWQNKYQMPNMHELIDSAAQIITKDTPGEVWFTSLDLKYAFSQLPLSELTSSHCNFSILCGEATGTYRFKTGFYGLTDMPTEFQKAMDCTLQGLEDVICYLDDILVVTKGRVEDHNVLVERVMSRLDEEVWALKLSKCEFSVNKLVWLGCEIDENGYAPKFSKIEAIKSLLPPKTLKQLRSFMGTLNHLQRFIPDLHKYTVAFRASLKAENKKSFLWGEEQTIAFQKILNLIANIPNLFHYDASKASRVKCDASHSGLGAYLEQEVEPNVWAPIAFASRFLNSAEIKYSTNELELLAIVWSCEHFRIYLLGTRFVILTDRPSFPPLMKRMVKSLISHDSLAGRTASFRSIIKLNIYPVPL